jgi:hypothetical protein
MLTEGYQLLRHLRNTPAALPVVYKDLHEVGVKFGPVLRVRLRADGRLQDLCLATEDETPGMWTLRNGNQNSFPVVRLAKPVWDLATDDPLRENIGSGVKSGVVATANVLRNFIRTRIASLSPNVAPELSRLGDEQAAPLLSIDPQHGLPPHVRAFVAAFRIFAAKPDCVVTLAESAFNGVQTTGDPKLLESVVDLLVGRVAKKRHGALEIAPMRVQLAFDLYEASIYSQDTRDATTLALSRAEAANASGSETTVCALSRTPSRLVTTTFPKINLPALRQLSPLFSKFSAAPCNARYHRFGCDAFDVGVTTANEVAAAYKYLTKETFRDKTWRPLFTGRFEAKKGGKSKKRNPIPDLLLVFISGEPIAENNPCVTHLLADDEAEFDFELRYEAVTEPICDAFRGIAQRRPDARATIMVIRKASKGQIQVAFSEQPSVADLLACAERWSKAATNLPAGIVAPVFPKNGRRNDESSNPIRRGPLALFPEQLSSLTTQQWLRDGSDARTVQAPPFAEIWDVFLERGPRSAAARAHILERLLALNSDLLIAAWGAFRAASGNDKKRLQAIPNEARLHALRTVTALGTLLHLMNSTVENYQHAAAFQLGRLLALADDLHRCYCLSVRGGQMPTTLIGNGLVSRAGDNPAEALAELNDRIRIYLGWAKIASAPDEAPASASDEDKRRKWQLRFGVTHSQNKVLPAFQLIAEPLAVHLSAQPLDAVGKSQLLLGYIADPLAQLKS